LANNRQIETLGVSYLATFINRNKLLQTYFDNNDKTPAWDGEIHVLKNASEKKSEIFGKVPVQIKATKQKNNSIKSFPVDMRDLELYSKNGGVVLFVVWLDENSNLKDIFYKSLPPFSIKKLIKKSKLKTKPVNNKRLSVQIHKLDEQKLYPMLVDFVTNSRKQYSFINIDGISVENIPNDKDFKLYFYGQGKGGIFNYQKEHDLFLYLRDPETGIEIPLENSIKVVETFEAIDLSIAVGDYIFKDVERHLFPNGSVQLHFGEGFKISFNIDKRQFKLNYSRPNMLSDAIKCTQALKELGKIGFFTLNRTSIELDERSLSDIASLDLDSHIKELLRISKFMKKMGIKKELDLSLFDEQSQKNLNILNSGLVLKKKVTLNYEESKLIHLKIANIHIIALYEFSTDNSGSMIDIFTETPWCRRGEDEDSSNISIFEVFGPKDWLTIDNCNFDSVIASYQRLVDNNLEHEGTDNTIIKIVAAADMTEEVSKKEQLLNWAQRLSDWNINHIKENCISIINDLQIKYRNRELDDTEIEKLTKILMNNQDNDEICFGASVLLKSKPQADFFWTKLDKETKERYQDYPIYNLYKML
jgi:genome